MSEEKVFLAKVKSVETQYGDILKISFGEEDLKKLAQHKNVAGWSNWEIKKSKAGTMQNAAEALEQSHDSSAVNRQFA